MSFRSLLMFECLALLWIQVSCFRSSLVENVFPLSRVRCCITSRYGRSSSSRWSIRTSLRVHIDQQTEGHSSNSPSVTNINERSMAFSRDVFLKLSAIGFFLGPAVDAIHNQDLLEYAILPMTIETPFAVAKSSLLVPPLLSVAYPLLGWVLPRVAKQLFGSARVPPPAAIAKLPDAQRAALAVATTAAILRVSALLAHSHAAPAPALAALSALALAQWRLLDGCAASLALAAAAAIGGPLAELPFTLAGGWQYTRADYWPLAPLGFGPDSGAGWAGLSALTGPCYFAVTTDAIALGRWVAGGQRGAGDAVPTAEE